MSESDLEEALRIMTGWAEAYRQERDALIGEREFFKRKMLETADLADTGTMYRLQQEREALQETVHHLLARIQVLEAPEIGGTLEYAGGDKMEFKADKGEPFLLFDDGDRVAITIRPLETGKTPPAETAS